MSRPTDGLPTWASDTNFSSGPKLGSPTKVEPSAGQLAQGHIAGGKFRSGFVNWFKDKLCRWVVHIDADHGRGHFGDGSDGNVTISTSVQLTRTMYYNDLTITGTGELEPQGWPIFVKGTLTIESGGIIHADGGAGSTFSGGVAQATSLFGEAGDGGDGADGDPATDATVGEDSAPASIGGDGGTGGDVPGIESCEFGAAGGTVTAPVASEEGYRHFHGRLGFTTDGTSLRGGAGGGGGGVEAGSGVGDPRGGGGGAGGSGVVIIAYLIVNDGIVRARGGAGAAGTTGGSGSASGGGGGGGGFLILAYRGKSGSGTQSVAGGAAGAGAGANGAAGLPGQAGTIIELLL